jgi:excisionase family DNA binding protein
MNAHEESPFLTVEGLAKRWMIHEESVRRMYRDGRIPIIKLSNKVRIPISEILRMEGKTQFVKNEQNRT